MVRFPEQWHAFDSPPMESFVVVTDIKLSPNDETLLNVLFVEFIRCCINIILRHFHCIRIAFVIGLILC